MRLIGIIFLSDPTSDGPVSDIGAPGFKYPGDFKWDPETRMQILDGRRFELPAEIEEFNAAVSNFARAHHRYRYPVPKIIALDTPAVVRPPLEYTPPVPVQPVEAPPPAIPQARPASPSARKFAASHGLDLDLVQGSGAAGLITLDDVKRAHGMTNADLPINQAPGNLSVADLAKSLNSSAA